MGLRFGHVVIVVSPYTYAGLLNSLKSVFTFTFSSIFITTIKDSFILILIS